MPPHGSRCFSAVTILLNLVLILSRASAASAVLGIDLGTEYIKAALVKPGIPFEIVLTKDSKRKEAAVIAFKPLRSQSSSSSSSTFPERLYGGDALAVSARYPGDVYSNLKPLLGQTVAGNSAVPHYASWHPALNIVESKDRGTVSFRSQSFEDTEEPFTVEELLGMELQNIRLNAEAFAGEDTHIRDVVISIPVFYTAEEKRAVEAAAELAGLKILAMISDGLSVGLNYATSRTFPVVKEGVKPEYHLVYDMGAGSTTATVLRFQGKNVKDVGRFNKTIQEVQVIGVGWDKSLGGDAFNALILEDMISKFVETPRLKTLGTTSSHVKNDGRTVAKLWKEAERMRQVLSANTETSTSFEGLFHEDANFKYKLSRTEFERFAGQYTNQVRGPITQAVSTAKLDLSDIESIILHGGAVRTPFVQKELETAVGSSEKVRTNVNSDEAAVLGAVFKAAGTSPSFIVKEIRASDSVGHAAGVSWLMDGKEKQQKLFQPTSHIGAEKQVPFKITQDFVFDLYQQVTSGGAAFKDVPVTKVQTQNLTASVKELTEKFGCSVADISTSFSIRLSPLDGLPEVTRGVVSCEVVDAKKGDFVDNVKGLFGFGSGSKKGDQEPLADGSSKDTTLDVVAETTASLSGSGKPVPSPADTKSNEKTKDTKKTEIIQVGFTTNATGLPQFSSSEMLRMKNRMLSFDASDRSRKLREEALNTLEGYTYKVRDILRDEGFVEVSTEKQRLEIEERLKNASDWLYGDGAEASLAELRSRLKELRDLVDPISKRKEEALKRPGDVKMLMESLEQTKGLIKMVKDQSEKAAEAAAVAASASAAATDAKLTLETTSAVGDDFAGLDDELSSISEASPSETKLPEAPLYSSEDLADLSRTHESVQKWLDDRIAEQEKLSPFEDPVILTSDLAAKSKELNKVVMDVLQKKMQIPPKVKSSSKSKSSRTKSSKKSKTTTTSASASPSSSLSPDSIPTSSSLAESEVPAATDIPRDKDYVDAEIKGKIRDEL
ncbi:lumenal Hsp70 protein [Xylographa opegraphella]|nr:lumenal Hsp70 protein [Xylographa opegraphella]